MSGSTHWPLGCRKRPGSYCCGRSRSPRWDARFYRRRMPPSASRCAISIRMRRPTRRSPRSSSGYCDRPRRWRTASRRTPSGSARGHARRRSRFREIKPDVSLELRIPAAQAHLRPAASNSTSPAAPSYNRDKFLAYDAFLTGWALAHPRYRTLGTRPVVVFVCRDAHTALAYAAEADRAMTGRIGAMGTPAARLVLRRPRPRLLRRRARHPPRLARRARTPPAAPDVREQLRGSARLELCRVELIADPGESAASGAPSDERD